MPSDERATRILEMLGSHREAFRRLVSSTVADVRSYLISAAVTKDGRSERVAAELGPFGVQRFDVERFAALFAEPDTLDKMSTETVEKAFNTLAQLAARQEDLFVVDVPPDGSMCQAVAKGLAEVGRVFGAVRIVDRIRTRRYRYSEHVRSLGAFPFAQWSKAERRLIPPFVVLVDGRDLHAIELAEFLDGAIKLILVVRGESPPAPLVRLITPQTFVMQTTDIADVARLLAWDGSGIAALVPDAAARFVHDPTAGSELWDRMSVLHAPASEPRKALGTMSAARMAEELRQLRALGNKPTPARGEPTASAQVASPSEPTKPADKLAAWLLRQADFSNVDS